MNRLMKKVTCGVLAGVLAVGLVGCGDSAKGQADTSTDAPTMEAASGTAEKAAEKTTEKSKGEKVTINVWSLYGTNPDDKQAVAFQEAIEEIMAENENIVINLDYAENEAYKTKIKAAVAANEAPDIYKVWGGGFTKPFVDAGKVLNINDYMKDDVVEGLLPGVLENFTYDNEVYGLPYIMSVCHLFVNKQIFEENQLEIPTTYNELLEVSKQLRAKGITPIALGAKDRWAIGKVFDMMGVRAVGIENVTKILSGEGSFKDPDFVNAAKKFEEMSKAGVFTENAVAITNDEALADFTLGKAAMFYNGSWSTGFINGESSTVKGNIVAIPFPVMEDGKGVITEFVGGASDGFVINKETKHPDEAFEVLRKLSYKMSVKCYQNSVSMPVWNVDGEVDESTIDPLFKSIADDAKDATQYITWWDTFFEGSAAQDYLYALIDLSMGNCTAEEFCDTLEELLY